MQNNVGIREPYCGLPEETFKKNLDSQSVLPVKNGERKVSMEIFFTIDNHQVGIYKLRQQARQRGRMWVSQMSTILHKLMLLIYQCSLWISLNKLII